MKKTFKILAIGLLAFFIIIQLVPSNLPENSEDLNNDLLLSEKVPENVKDILVTSCYDCHSNQTVYPWYSYVAPVSWLVSKDTREGREELNFSLWAELSKRKKIKALNNIAEEIEDKKMPLEIYTVIHKNSILSDNDIEAISDWTKSLSNEILGGE